MKKINDEKRVSIFSSLVLLILFGLQCKTLSSPNVERKVEGCDQRKMIVKGNIQYVCLWIKRNALETIFTILCKFFKQKAVLRP